MNFKARKRSFQQNIFEEIDNRYLKKWKSSDTADEDDMLDILLPVLAGAGIVSFKKERKKRGPNRFRESGWWEYGYENWSDEEFKNNLRLHRQTFELVLNVITPFIIKQPTNMKPFPTPPEKLLGLTLYRLAHGCSFPTVGALFGVSESLASTTFNKVVRVLVATMYDDYVKLPSSSNEWQEQLKGFIENYEFPCVGAWDGFHVYVSSKIKSYFSFNKRYTMSSLGLIGYNKSFHYAAVGAPGSTHDARMLKSTRLYQSILDGKVLPEKTMYLEDSGNIPLVTVGDSAFPRHPWLLKGYNENTTDKQQRYFNKKLCSARVVTENAYGMLKGRWRILYKKTECRMHNLKYVIMSCIMLHNLCIKHKDPCEPRWRLEVKELSLMDRKTTRGEDKNESDLIRLKISNWLWNM